MAYAIVWGRLRAVQRDRRLVEAREVALNREWHLAHRMPPNATLDQRIDWHLEHARECGCRELPASVVKARDRFSGVMPSRLASTAAATRPSAEPMTQVTVPATSATSRAWRASAGESLGLWCLS